MNNPEINQPLQVFFIVGTDRRAINEFSSALLSHSQYYNQSDPGKAVVRSNQLIERNGISEGIHNLKSRLHVDSKNLSPEPTLVDYLKEHCRPDSCLVLSDHSHTHLMHEWVAACRSLDIRVRALYLHQYNVGNGKNNLSLLGLYESATRECLRASMSSEDLDKAYDTISNILSKGLEIRTQLINICLDKVTVSKPITLPADLEYLSQLLIHNCNSGWSHPIKLAAVHQCLEESMHFGGLVSLPLYSTLHVHYSIGDQHELTQYQINVDTHNDHQVRLPLAQFETIRILNLSVLNSTCLATIEKITIQTKSNKLIDPAYTVSGDCITDKLIAFKSEQPMIRIEIGTYASAMKAIEVRLSILNTAKVLLTLMNTYGQVDRYPTITSSLGPLSVYQSPQLEYTIDTLYLFQDRYLIIKGWAHSTHDLPIVRLDINGHSHNIPVSYHRSDVAALFVEGDYSTEPSEDPNAFLETIDVELITQDPIEYMTLIVNDGRDTLCRKLHLTHVDRPYGLSLNNQYNIQKLQWEQSGNPNKLNQKITVKPLISIVTPVYNVEARWLDLCIQSVRQQTYTNWELCLYDDCSTDQETLDCLAKWEAIADPRIKIGYGSENVNISGATNGAINLASGGYITFLDNDDELTPDALYVVAQYLNKYPDTTLMYSDEDKLEMTGHRTGPYFKSDFNIDLLRSNNYFTHLTVVKYSLGQQIGWMRLGYEGAQDHDFVLRAVDATDHKKIRHIPEILYHWRKIPTSTAGNYGAKSYAWIAGIRALQDHMVRNYIEGNIEKGAWGGAYRMLRILDAVKKVSIIIPFKDHVYFIKALLPSIAELTHYENYEILLINNRSEEKETLDYLDDLKLSNLDVKVLDYDYPFNYAAMNNWAVNQADGEYILLLNNDMKVKTRGWLTSMVEHIQRPEVGVVGCKLLYADDTLQHAGVLMGINGSAGHAFKGMPDNTHYFNMGVIKNVSGVTGACLLTKKDLYHELGGLDEDLFKVAYNDVDYCLKVRQAGKLIVYTPYSVLYHYESKSRGYEDTPEKEARHMAEKKSLQDKWGINLSVDPYYNPNFSYQSQANALAIEVNKI